MSRKHLTAKGVETIKPVTGRGFARDVPDGLVQGLNLVVHPSGRKSWAFRYRFGGRQKRLTFEKRFPGLSLAEARDQARACLLELEEGRDPGAGPEPEPVPKPPDLVKDVVEEYLRRYVRPRLRTAREIERILKREAAGRWGRMPIRDIGRADLLRVLDDIMDRDSPAMANKSLRVMRRFFSWCVERGLRDDSPADRLKAPARELSRDRVLDSGELAEVWQAAETLGYPMGPLLKLLILTAQRRGEVAGMRWRQVDLEAGLWTLPREAVKSGRAHDVPLSPAAVEILSGLPRFINGDCIFSTTGGRKPVNSFSKAKDKLDSAILAARREAAQKRGEDPAKVEPPPPWTMHDIRRSVATWLAKENTPPHVVSALLNHSPGRAMGVSAIYIRHRYPAERRAALEAWAAHVGELVRPAAGRAVR